MPLVSDIAEAINDRYNLAQNGRICSRLKLQGYQLPFLESSLLLKDDDRVNVVIELKDDEEADQDTKRIQDKDPEEKSKKKRKHDAVKDSSEGEEESAKKKKKKNRKHANDAITETQDAAEVSREDLMKKSKRKEIHSPLIEDRNQRDDTHYSPKDKKQLKSKECSVIEPSPSKTCMKQNKDMASKLEECVVNITDDLGINHKEKHAKQSVDEQLSCSEPDQEMSADNLDRTENDTNGVKSKRKRKRVRKPRKRHGGNISSTSINTSFNDSNNSDTSYTEGSQKNAIKYEGRQIAKNDLFFGSIPDKLQSPKHYRHGYRNMNVYQPIPNKHTKFDSGSDSEPEISENTEQYNFLSSTRILEDRDEYKTQMDENGCSGIIDDKQQNGFTDSIELSEIIPSNVSEVSNDTMAHVSDDSNVLEKNIGRSDTLEDSQLLTAKDMKSDESASLSYTATPFKYPEPLDRSRRGRKSVDTPTGAASPSIMTRKQLPNGVSVFVRQRGPHRGNVQELTKEQQLNTSATNVSTIFRNGGSPQRPVTETVQTGQPAQPALGFSSEHSSPSINGKFSAKHSSPSVNEKPRVNGKPNGDDISPCAVLHDKSPSTQTATVTDVIDYTKLPALVGTPRSGDKIVYKVLEMSLSCTPEVSEYKEAEVLSVDSKQMVELRNITLPLPGSQRNKFHVEVEDDDGVLTNSRQPEEKVKLHISSLLEPRLMT